MRAIPADGDYGASVDSSITYVTTIKDYALVFEADLPAPSTARVLVSGLNIMNSSGLPSVGPGRWIFDTYVVQCCCCCCCPLLSLVVAVLSML